MMDPETDSRPSERDESRLSSPGDSSDSASDTEATLRPTEWLATARQRRSTAGNRMKSMLANEEPDDDLELLFAEDDEDQGFSDVDAGDASDVLMDSSSDDEDENNAGDDDEGEKELERQAREARRAAQRKRKAHEAAIPAKFRKKVRIDPTTSSGAGSTPSAPAPRPKKKSERASWLPTAADMPTRASSRQTTRLSKEQLHQQMEEREARRLKQVAQMQKKAARLEALKKPPMTQEERLREAEAVEKRNARSLNRWEEAERQREEERRAKLAALNERTLKGPVITFWSGMGKGRRIVMEEKPKKRKEKDKDKGKEKEKGKVKVKDEQKDEPKDGVSGAAEERANKEADPPATTDEPPEAKESTKPEEEQPSDATTATVPEESKKAEPQPPHPAKSPTPVADAEPRPVSPTSKQEATSPLMAMPPVQPPSQSQTQPQQSTPPTQPLSGLAAPPPPPEASGRLMSPPDLSRPQDARPSGVLAAPTLAPPPGIIINGAPPPNRNSPGAAKSSVLAPPDTSQQAHPPPSLSAPSLEPNQPTAPPGAAEPTLRDTHLQPIQNQAVVSNKSAPAGPSEPAAEAPEEESADAITTRNSVVFQNFDENAIKDKSVQTQILFGRKMSKLSKPAPTALCVITNHPARYRDPKTGLPYHNAQAYREIQRLSSGKYKWSRLLGAWVGSGTYAARGVPERFLHPDKKRETPKGEATKDDMKPSEEGKAPETEKQQGGKQDAVVQSEDAKGRAAQPAAGMAV